MEGRLTFEEELLGEVIALRAILTHVVLEGAVRSANPASRLREQRSRILTSLDEASINMPAGVDTPALRNRARCTVNMIFDGVYAEEPPQS